VERLDSVSIRVSNLTKLYGEQKALDAVSFDLPDRQIVGLLGPNGAGKSTLMKILTGYLPATSGNAQVCGLEVGTDALDVKQKVGYLPEHNPLYTDLYIAEYLHFVAGLYGAPSERVEEMIAQTGLSPERHKIIGQLSKGYRQRVGLAAALLHDPEVLILDEPTTGLDPNQLVEIRALIKRVGQSKTVVLSTHILQEVEHLCDRVLIIHHGRIVRDAQLAELQAEGGLENAFRNATRVG